MVKILKKILLCVGIVFCVFLSYALWTLYEIASSRKTLSLGSCSTIEMAKKYGLFLWEYEPDTLYVCDSIPLVVTSAFARRDGRWKNYESDSIVFLNSSQVFCTFDTCYLTEGNWVYLLKNAEYIIVDCNRRFNEAFPPDSSPVYIIERKHHYNENGEMILDRNPQGCLLKGDTIQTLYLHKKK